MKQVAAIVGIGETPVGRFPDRNGLELQAQAVRLALADARIDKSHVNSLYTLGSYIQPVMCHALSVAEYLGIKPAFEGTFDVGGTPTFIGMALDALAAVENGRAEVAVCVYGDNAATRRPPGSHGYIAQVLYGTEEFEDPFGSSILVSYALLAQRYLNRYGLDPGPAFWPVASALRRHAVRNGNVVRGKPMTREEYFASEMIADPFRRLDCSPLADGAGAFVIASNSYAAKLKLRHPPIAILGSGTQVTHKIVTLMPEIENLGLRAAGQRAFAEAGLTPADVDLVTIHDGFTISILVSLEELGFCKPGEASALIADGWIDLGGALPTNTHGGLMSQGHVGGILHVVEAVRQLQGRAEGRQVADAEIAMVAGNGGVFSISGAMLLGKGLGAAA